MKQKVVIITPAWLHGDGVGHDVEGMARALLAAGHEVLVYAPQTYASIYEIWRVDEETVRSAVREKSTTLIYHHSIGNDQLESILREAKCAVRIMRYHNVTPPEFFERYSAEWVRMCQEGREATPRVAALCNHFSVPSFYDARDLIHAGINAEAIHYDPYFHKLEDFDRTEPDSDIVERLRNDRRLHVLFVGRRVPNKGHLHLIRVVAQYVQLFDKDIVLHLVGSADSAMAGYDREILDEIRDLDVQENILIYDKLSFKGIIAFYKESHAFLCMSEHEGFCIPVIEAEYCGLPVVAYYRRGVPEALGPTQPWFTSLQYEKYASILREIYTDSKLAAKLSVAGRRSVDERFNINDIRNRFLKWFESLFVGQQSAALAVKRRIAFVIQRYGDEVSGGAETFARLYVSHLSKRHDITVLTTQSKTVDWDNEITSASEIGVDGRETAKIVRFPSVSSRDWEAFDRAKDAARLGKLTFSDWLKDHGPNVPALREYIIQHAEDFDIIINWTYLYSTVGYVAEASGKTILVNVPFYHDEEFLYYSGHQAVASKFDAFIFQTEAEKKLAARVGPLGDRKSIVLGVGIEEDEADAIRNAETVSPLLEPYILYVGRIETSKGIDELIDYFQKFKHEHHSNLKLVMIGRSHNYDVPIRDDIILPGFVTPADKFRYIKHARAVVNSSALESFSLILLEAWSQARPVVVTHRCEATTEQVVRSGGGIVYRNYRDFSWTLKQLERRSSDVENLGTNGQLYYDNNYRWTKIMPKFEQFIEELIRTDFPNGVRHGD